MTLTEFIAFFRELSGENTLATATLTTLIQQAQKRLDDLVAGQFDTQDNTKTLVSGAYSVAVGNAKRIDRIVLCDSTGLIVGNFTPGELVYPSVDPNTGEFISTQYWYPQETGCPTGCRIEYSSSLLSKSLIFDKIADQAYTLKMFGEFAPSTLDTADIGVPTVPETYVPGSANVWTTTYPMVLFTATELQLATVYSNAERTNELRATQEDQLTGIANQTAQAEDPGYDQLQG